MRAAIVSHYDKTAIANAIKRHGFLLSPKPQFVFTYGGDGTILEAESMFPGIPLVPVQKSRICSHCSVYSVVGLDRALHAIRQGKYSIRKEQKIEAVFKGKSIHALNDIQVHVKDPRRALRFSVRSGKLFYKEIIGDGFVASTSYGSGAYYRAIGNTPFKKGIRLGFNNVWPRLPFAQIDREASVKIIREHAYLAADNFFLKEIRPGDSIKIRQSKKIARFVDIN